MIVITTNGKTTVYKGWRAWLLGAVAFVAVMLLFALTTVFLLGFAITLGLLMLLAVPAMIVVAGIAALLGRRRAG
jgi:hypothetical protein